MDEKPLVIIVDDENSIIMGLQFILEREGCRILHPSISEDIGQFIARHNPKLVIMDYKLRDANGWDIVKELKKSNSTSHITIIGYGE